MTTGDRTYPPFPTGIGVRGSASIDTWEVGPTKTIQTLNDLSDELGNQPILPTFIQINLDAGDLGDEPFYFAPNLRGSFLLIQGTRTALSTSGTFTSFFDWTDTGKRIARGSFNSLPTSWTASGLVGKFINFPNLGSNVNGIVGGDIGTKTMVCSGAWDYNNESVASVSDNVFTTYDCSRIATTTAGIFAPKGAGSMAIIDTVIGSTGSQIFFEGPVSALQGCRIEGALRVTHGRSWFIENSYFSTTVDNVGSEPTFYNCVFASTYRNHAGIATFSSNNLLFGTSAVITPIGGLVQIGSVGARNVVEAVTHTGGACWVYAYCFGDGITGALLHAQAGNIIGYTDAAKIGGGSVGGNIANLYNAGGTASASLPVDGINIATTHGAAIVAR